MCVCVCQGKQMHIDRSSSFRIQTTTTKNEYQKEENLNKDSQGLTWENNNDQTLNLPKNQMFCKSIWSFFQSIPFFFIICMPLFCSVLHTHTR
jgi:hypothetical protein